MTSRTQATPHTVVPVPAQTIGVGQGVALYVCAILGAGVLVLPGQAASLAGPGALIAWGFSALLGVPLAFTFASLATRFPDAGGVATFAAKAFGPSAGGIAGWWYFIAGSVGHTIVPLTAGYYVAAALGVDQRWAPAFAAVVLAAAIGANLVGIRLGARLQIALALGVAAILITVIAVAAPRIEPENFTSFAPHGILGIGQAVVLLFFAFAGWEAIAHLSAEFRDVRRTLPRATLLTIVVVTVLYLGVAVAVVGTGAYGSREQDRISLGTIVEQGWGVSAGAVMAVAAVVICLGTTNAYAASLSRLGAALARDGWAPAALARRNAHGAPHLALLAIAGVGGAGLIGAAVFGWGTDDLVFIPSVLVIATYLLGTAAAAKLFRGRSRSLAIISIVLLALVAPFAGWHLVVPPAIAVGVLLFARKGRAGPGVVS
ncbi:amino acid permease [Microbacterium sp. NPDC057650]|uniref:amino acid permease n=1 Tax=unclassified Microbacterium TaxID=2609290 RepID=UPI00366E33B6